MRPEGTTGVQTHFNTFIEVAKKTGVDVQLLTPFDAAKALVYPVFGFRKFVERLSMELGSWWYWYWHYIVLRHCIFQRLDPCLRTAIVYAQDLPSAKAALDLKNRGGPIEVVLVVHFNVSQASEWTANGYIREGGWVYDYLVKLERQVLPRVDRLLFPSRFMQQQVMGRVLEAQRVPSWVIPYFVSRSGTVEKRGPVASDLITIGTLDPRKNHEFLLRALKHAHQLGYPYRLSIVGYGFPNRRRELKALGVDLGLDEHVKFTGHLPNAAGLIPHHRVYVHSARMDNFPFAIVEALAAGKPVLAAPVGGVPEVFSNGVQGLYWDLDDPHEAAKLLIKIMENRALYEQMSRAAQERYELHLSPEALYPRWMEAVLGSS